MADAIWYLDAGGIDFSNVSVQIEVTAVEAGTDTNGVAIRFRRSDESNWWEFGMNTGVDTSYVLRKTVAGDVFMVSQPGTVRSAGDVLRVETYEDRINCYVNEVLVATVSDTDLMNNEDVGLRFSSGCVDTEIDDFYAQQQLVDIRNFLTYYPEYQILVDWDNDGGLSLGDFEAAQSTVEGESDETGGLFDGWEAVVGSRPATLEITKEKAKSGTSSLKVSWTNFNLFQFDVTGHGFGQGQLGGDEFVNPPNSFKFNQAGQGFDQGVFATTRVEANPTLVSAQVSKTISKLVPGREYEIHAWVWVPTGSTAVGVQVADIAPIVYSTTNDQWEELVFPYTATATEHTIVFVSSDANPDTGEFFYLDQVMNLGGNEDITCYVLNTRTSLNVSTGRDQARSLASFAPSEFEMEVDNSSQIFSPDNPGSLLAGYLAPGKPIVVRATYNNQTVGIFHGFIDNYTLNPDPENQSVTFTCIDGLQFLANATVSTEVYPSIQTGQAVNVILDAVGWPAEKRAVAPGASTIKWWSEEDTDGLSAIQALVESEGIPANAFVDSFGNFVFTSRHHRLLESRSLNSQITYRSCSEHFDEPNFSGPITYDIGWKDIINQVDVQITDRTLQELDEVWKSEDLLIIPAGDTKTIKIKASAPFYNAVMPTVGFENVLDNDADIGKDIVLKTGSGSLTSIELTRTSGKSTDLILTAGASSVTIRKIRLRAFGVVENDSSLKVFQQDSTSVELYGKKGVTTEFPWVNVNDMEAIAEIVLGQRSERLPVVYIKLNNGHPVRLSSLLNRRIQDRIHIEESLQTFMKDDYIVEVIEHEISDNGHSHVTTLGCEKAREQKQVEEGEAPPPTFTFDVDGLGFDQGYFIGGDEGFTFANSLFILDQSNLNEDGLGF